MLLLKVLLKMLIRWLKVGIVLIWRLLVASLRVVLALRGAVLIAIAMIDAVGGLGKWRSDTVRIRWWTVEVVVAVA